MYVSLKVLLNVTIVFVYSSFNTVDSALLIQYSSCSDLLFLFGNVYCVYMFRYTVNLPGTSSI